MALGAERPMKTFTRMVLLSSAIVFPAKAEFSTPKESAEGGRRKRSEMELVVKSVPCLKGSENTCGVPAPDLCATGGRLKALDFRAAQPEPRKMRIRLTFYSGKDDRWGSRVAWNKAGYAKRGRTVAADPTIFPYGTWIAVPGFGRLRVEDTGSAVKTKKASGGNEPVIDVYVGDAGEVIRIAKAAPHYVEITLL